MTPPLGGLLRKDAYETITKQMQASRYIGIAQVEGVACHHLAFSDPAINWQVWVDSGPKPMLRKIRVEHKFSSDTPRYTGTIVSLEENPDFTPDIFQFVPPTNATLSTAVSVDESGTPGRSGPAL